ncbi:MAG: SEC-C domain-containing protein, partial [Chloroflexi bacterium]|nr:SEC-C domain-containing protein [Chloroflexota bacterium]
VEGFHFEIRKHLVDYDDVVNTHRSVIYKLRDKILAQEDLRSTIEEMIEKELKRIADSRLQGQPEDWDIDGLFKELQTVYPQPKELSSADAVRDLDGEEVNGILLEHAKKTYAERIQQFGEIWKQIERIVMLRTIDQHWVEHLTAMDNMRTGIGLEAVGQRDPLVQYKQTAYGMFGELMENIEHDVAHTIFRVAPVQQPVEAQPTPKATATRGAEARPGDGAAPKPAQPAGPRGPAVSSVLRQKSVMSAVTGSHGADAVFSRKIGRNEFCPCGSGKKYKRCHGANA